MTKIKFTASDHTYREGKIPYTSVSKILGKYKTFDSKYWSTYKAYEKIYDDINGKGEFKKLAKSWEREDYALFGYMDNIISPLEMEKERKKVLDDWNKKNKRSIAKGNIYHESAEASSYARGFEVNPFTGDKTPTIKKETIKGVDNHSLSTDLFELEDGFYPELLIWNEQYRIAGQADKVFIRTLDDGTRVVDLDDYKTNKKINIESFKHPTHGYTMMKAPLDHIMDCNFRHYELQLSFYAWMMECFGFHIGHMCFHHFNTRYDLDYRKTDVAIILEDQFGKKY